MECKKAVPKADPPEGTSGQNSSGEGGSNSGSAAGGVQVGQARTRKIFVGGLAPAADEQVLRTHFEQFGPVEDAVVMYDHDNMRPRGFGFVTFTAEDSVDSVFGRGAMQTILDKQIEIKPAVPRDQIAPAPGQQRPGVAPYNSRQGPPSYSAPYSSQHGYGVGFPPRPPPPSILQQQQGYGPPPTAPQQQQQGYWHNLMPPPPMDSQLSGGRNGVRQAYGPVPGAAGFAGPRAGYGGAGTGSKVQQGGISTNGPSYEQLYGLANGNGAASAGMPFSSNAQALYNLAGFPQQQLNGMPGTDAKQLISNQALHLKALGLGALAGLQGYGRGGDGYDNTSDEYAAQASAAAAAGGLGGQTDFSYDPSSHNFSTAPAPGWSS